MSSPSPRRFFPFLVMFPIMMVAAAVLGYLSYRASSQLAAKTAVSVGRSNRVLGLKLIDRIEKVVIDTDRAFFRLVRLDDPREFRELWRRIVRVSPAVESVVVLDERREVVHLVAKLGPGSAEHFHRMFVRRILPDLELSKLPRDSHKHLHKVFDGKPYLLSYIRQRSGTRDYYIVLNVNLRHVSQEVFAQEFRELEETSRIAVVDEHGRAIYGTKVGEEPLSFQGLFPTTLYKWTLQIAPRQMSALSKEVQARSVSDLILVIGAVGVIWIGMLVLMAAIRKERRANELKSEFIANVSHELKTPLSLIRMFGELLALGRTRDDRTAKEYAEIITRESDRLTGLIDNVLDFARIERGKAAYEMAEGDLRGAVERAVELCRYRVEQAGVQLEVGLEEVPPAVFDDSAMTLVVLNLIENALKYGTERGDTLRVELEPVGDFLELRVADAGPGIAPDEARRIFERFYRGSSARTRAQRGSGIGLALVKHIAAAHGGRAEVRSDVGKGSTFAVSIPARGEPQDR